MILRTIDLIGSSSAMSPLPMPKASRSAFCLSLGQHFENAHALAQFILALCQFGFVLGGTHPKQLDIRPVRQSDIRRSLGVASNDLFLGCQTLFGNLSGN